MILLKMENVVIILKHYIEALWIFQKR